MVVAASKPFAEVATKNAVAPASQDLAEVDKRPIQNYGWAVKSQTEPPSDLIVVDQLVGHDRARGDGLA